MGGPGEDEAELTASLWAWAGALGLELDAAQREMLLAYARALEEASRRVNLTGAKGMGEILLRHVADGLAAAGPLRELLRDAPQARACDLGAGAGFVGFALKAAWPQAEVTLLERSRRKFDFLNLAAARSGLKGLRVARQARPGSFDAVLARALAPFPEAAAVALPLAAPGGFLLVYQSEAPAAAAAERLLPEGARLIKSIAYRLPRESRERHLVILRRN